MSYNIYSASVFKEGNRKKQVKKQDFNNYGIKTINNEHVHFAEFLNQFWEN